MSKRQRELVAEGIEKALEKAAEPRADLERRTGRLTADRWTALSAKALAHNVRDYIQSNAPEEYAAMGEKYVGPYSSEPYVCAEDIVGNVRTALKNLENVGIARALRRSGCRGCLWVFDTPITAGVRG